MKRKLPVLIAIAITLIILLAACQPQNQPTPPATQGNTTPTTQTTPIVQTTPTVPVDATQSETTPTLPAEQPPAQTITMDEAIAIALKDAGFTEADVTGLHAELDRDDGVTFYDVDFYKDGKEYDYEVHAETGKILEPVKKPASTNEEPAKQLTKDQAISKALSHAGLSKSQVSRLTAKLDRDDGITLYEVEFETPEYEYDYEIHATTGKVLKAEKDRDD